MKIIQLGMVGGGRSSQIGDSHRVAANRDGLFKLSAGAFDKDPLASVEFGKKLGIDSSRAYADYRAMLQQELTRDDGIDAVSIMTPNGFHFEMASAFAANGIHVICEKPVTTTVEDAIKLAELVKDKDIVFGVMYGYTGYPMIKQAREMVRNGELGEIHTIKSEFAHGHAMHTVEQEKEGAAWRVDPKISGPSFVLADVGTHAYHIAGFVSGLKPIQVCAHLTSVVRTRPLEDNAFIWLKYPNGANGTVWASAVATGNQHGLNLRIYGSKASLQWHQERPNQLIYKQTSMSTKIYERGADDLYPAARIERVGVGHPEGYFESFSNVYRQFGQAIQAKLANQSLPVDYPGIDDGIQGVKFIESCLTSQVSGQAWVNL